MGFQNVYSTKALVLWYIVSAHLINDFANGFSSFNAPVNTKSSTSMKLQTRPESNEQPSIECTKSRRSILNQVGIACTAALLPSFGLPSFAEEALSEIATAAPTNTIPMKNFIDPKGLFALRVPQNFYTLRRTVKGDLPDEKTGKGRRGASIFTAGDMAKAEVVAVELFPTRALLEDEGFDASGDLSTFDKLGQPVFVANLLSVRREKDKPGKSKTTVMKDSVKLSDDKKSLFFELRTDVDVQKPELLFEQMGVTELVRITLGKADLNSNNGQMMVCYASALDVDYKGADGPALKEVVDSFVAMNQQ